jgi:hypothetical protein
MKDCRIETDLYREAAFGAARRGAGRVLMFFEGHVAGPLMQRAPGMAHLILAVAVEMARERGLGHLTNGRPQLASWMRSMSELPSMQKTAQP